MEGETESPYGNPRKHRENSTQGDHTQNQTPSSCEVKVLTAGSNAYPWVFLVVPKLFAT